MATATPSPAEIALPGDQPAVSHAAQRAEALSPADFVQRRAAVEAGYAELRRDLEAAQGEARRERNKRLILEDRLGDSEFDKAAMLQILEAKDLVDAFTCDTCDAWIPADRDGDPEEVCPTCAEAEETAQERAAEDRAS